MSKLTYLFENTPSQELTDAAFRLQQANRLRARFIVRGSERRLIVEGECPRCGGTVRLDRSNMTSIFKGGNLGGGDRAGEFAAETVVCNGPAITGTPPGKRGCGACFTVYAPIEEAGAK